MVPNEHLAQMFARNMSLYTIRENVNYSIGDIAVKATTVSNSGVIINIYNRQKKHTKKCFFLAVIHGFRENNIKIFNNLDVSQLSENDVDNLYAFKLAQKYNMLNNKLVDTDKPYHLRVVENIARSFRVRIEFYMGHYKDQWYTTPDPAYVIGISKTVIRILNRGAHFEYLLENESIIQDLTTSTITNVIANQHVILKDIEIIEADLKFAKQLVEDEELLEAQRRQRECEDYEFAVQLEAQEGHVL